MDAFSFHPYADNSSQSPDFAHPLSTTIGIADYGKLVSLLAEAFDGTAQPGSTLPLLYDEFGVESVVPEAKAPLYTGTEPEKVQQVETEMLKEAAALLRQRTADGRGAFGTDQPLYYPATQIGFEPFAIGTRQHARLFGTG